MLLHVAPFSCLFLRLQIGHPVLTPALDSICRFQSRCLGITSFQSNFYFEGGGDPQKLVVDEIINLICTFSSPRLTVRRHLTKHECKRRPSAPFEKIAAHLKAKLDCLSFKSRVFIASIKPHSLVRLVSGSRLTPPEGGGVWQRRPIRCKFN